MKQIIFASVLGAAFLIAAPASAQSGPCANPNSANCYRAMEKASDPEVFRNRISSYGYNNGYNNGMPIADIYGNRYQTQIGRTKKEKNPQHRYQFCEGTGWSVNIGKTCPQRIVSETVYPDGRIVRTYAQ